MIEKRLLNTIQSGSSEEMYGSVMDAALYLAMGSFLQEANVILEAFWKHDLPDDGNTWLVDRAFEVLWHAAGKRPDFVPFPSTPIDQLEIEHRNYLGGEHYNYPIPEVAWDKLTGKDAFRQAQTWFATVERDTETLFLLEKALQEPAKLAPYEFCNATAIAAEIAARQGNEDVAIRMAQWWAEKYLESSHNSNISVMGCSRHVAPLILRGILTQSLDLSKEKCQQLAEEVITAMEHRMQVGRSLVYGYWHWDQLLKKLSDLAIAFEEEAFSIEERETRWIGRSAASEEAIHATEKRLGLSLPDDYKDFLKISNGLSAFPMDHPALIAVEEIDWYKKLEEPELYDLLKIYWDMEAEDEEATIEPYTQRALLISYIPDDQMIWLIPPIDETQDWQTWYFAAWLPGERRYPSFRHFMEKCILTLEEQS